MTPETTPAVENAARHLNTLHRTDDMAARRREAVVAGGALLDVEEVARELFVADSWQDRDFMLHIWRTAPEDQVVKEHWRRIARGLRAALLGADS